MYIPLNPNLNPNYSKLKQNIREKQIYAEEMKEVASLDSFLKFEERGGSIRAAFWGWSRGDGERKKSAYVCEEEKCEEEEAASHSHRSHTKQIAGLQSRQDDRRDSHGIQLRFRGWRGSSRARLCGAAPSWVASLWLAWLKRSKF